MDNAPEWLEKRYLLLLKEFGEREFSGEQARQLLMERSRDDEKSVPVIMSDMKKRGWLEAQLDPSDSRKRVYHLKSKENIFKEALSLDKEFLSQRDIESILKKAADLIRTRVDYKFILILLFLKRISDKWEDEYAKAVKEVESEGLSQQEAHLEAKRPAYHQFDLPEEFLWENLRKDVSKLPERFSHALRKIGELNPELKDALDNTDFIQFTSNTENAELLRQLVELFSERKLHHVSPDILGNAYEWILRYFAPQKAKEGEVYTPREVIRLLVEILKPKAGESVYDPTSASNGMLIESYRYVEEHEGKEKARTLFLFGQEYNPKTLALGRMNMYIHDIRDFQLQGGDTLLYPRFKDKESIKQFEVVIANPPWNQDGYDETVIKKGEFWQQRFSYGFAPKQSADWAWIQHMLASAKLASGRLGIIIDNGCLFRGGKEEAIRERILTQDLIECVLVLPEKLFYNTGAPGAILFLNKHKRPERKGKVLFINASSDFGKHPHVRKLNILTKENIAKIVNAYDSFSNVKDFSRVVSLDEIKTNDHNLNVSLYVFPEGVREDIDVSKEWNELKALKHEEQAIDAKIEGFLKEIK